MTGNHPGQPAPQEPWDDPKPQPYPGPNVRDGHPDLDTLTDLLPSAAEACARWGQLLVDGWRDGDSGPLAESRAVAKRVANLLTTGGRP